MHESTEQTTRGGILLALRESILKRLQEMRGDQSGAVGLLILAATLIVFMLALVIYDTGEVARDNMEVQAAADTAVWSQTAIEARSMNMIAFANVGKKVTFGMTSYYQALTIAYAELLVIATVLTIACWVANFFAFGSLTEICRMLTFFTAEVAYIIFMEAPDIIKFETDLNLGYFADDMKAFDDYQNYMAQITPWWSWSEGFIRGSRNGATAASGWPLPQILSGTPQNTGLSDALPIQKPSNIITKGYMQNMCGRLYSNSEFDDTSAGSVLTSDALVHFGDYELKSCILPGCTSEAPGTSGWERPVIIAITGLMAIPQLPIGCGIQAGVWEEAAGLNGAGSPFEIQMFENEAEWLLRSSNLMFAYRTATGRNSDEGDRKKYGFMSADHGAAIPFMHDATGTWSLARAEMSYQFGNSSDLKSPDLWHPSWTVRMRPVALPGEWSGNGENTNMNRAWHDAAAYIAAGALMSNIMGGRLDLNATDVISDIARIELSTRGLDDENIEGLGK